MPVIGLAKELGEMHVAYHGKGRTYEDAGLQVL